MAPDADLADEVDQSQVEDAVQTARGAFYVAVLPGGSSRRVGPDIVARELAAAVDADGTYVIVVGEALRVASTEVDDAGRIGERAVSRSDGDATTALVSMIAEIDAAPAGGGDGSGLGGQLLVVVLAGLAVLAVVLGVGRRDR